jgi:hypothetical protein
LPPTTLLSSRAQLHAPFLTPPPLPPYLPLGIGGDWVGCKLVECGERAGRVLSRWVKEWGLAGPDSLPPPPLPPTPTQPPTHMTMHRTDAPSVVPRFHPLQTPVETDVFYSNGSDDPWQRAAVNATLSDTQPEVTAVCDGCGHCGDLETYVGRHGVGAGAAGPCPTCMCAWVPSPPPP